MEKKSDSSPKLERWGNEMAKEADRYLPRRTISRFIRLLEQKGLIEQHDGSIDPTEEFRKLFVKAVESLQSWYKPSPMDEPQSLIAQEMARLIFGLTSGKIEKGEVKPEDMGHLTSVLVGILRHYFQGRDSKKLMDLIRDVDNETG